MSYSNWSRILLFLLAHKQCIGNINGWFHRLMSESIRFLVINVLMFDSACLVMVPIQFSLIKIIKIGHPEHLLTPVSAPPCSPPTFDNISFFLIQTNMVRIEVICVSLLFENINKIMGHFFMKMPIIVIQKMYLLFTFGAKVY